MKMDCKLHWYPKFCINVILFVGLKTLDTFLWKVQNILNKVLIYRRDNIVYHHWGSPSIYPPLSYPSRSLREEDALVHILQFIKFSCISYLKLTIITLHELNIQGRLHILEILHFIPLTINRSFVLFCKPRFF